MHRTDAHVARSLICVCVCWVRELIPVLGCQPAGDVSHKPGLQLPPKPLAGLLPILLLGEQRHNGCEQFA